MSSKENKKYRHHKGENILVDESRDVLIAYHKIQMKRDQLVNPAESAIFPLLDLLDDVRTKWKHAEDRQRAAEERADRSDQYNKNLIEERKEWLKSQREMAGEISMLKTDKVNLEESVKDMERRFMAVKKLIHQNLDETVEYDKIFEMTRKSKRVTVNEQDSSDTNQSADEVKLRYNRAYRRSRSVEPVQQRKSQTKRTRGSQFEYIDEESENQENEPKLREPSVKRSRGGREDDAVITTVTTITMDASGKRPTRGSIEVHKNKKRSVSASRVLDDQSAKRRQLIVRSPRVASVVSNSNLRHGTPNAIGSSWTRGCAISDCVHKFIPHRSLISSCSVCNRQITFMGSAVQCDHCKICVHDNCKGRAPIPCLPTSSFPKTPSRHGSAKVALLDYCPVNPPYIPAILIRCIYALEKDRMNTEGIYRIPGKVNDIERLYKEFSKYVPDLEREETEVITSCIKMFLNKLKEPLIPRSSYSEFMKATDDERLIQAVGELPEPNRDTLAYICLHLQRVAANSARNRMEVDNLASILCPTILGDNIANMTKYGGNLLEEQKQQQIVLSRLLKMPAEFWSDYLNSRIVSKVFSSAVVTPTTPTTHHKTPLLRATPSTALSPSRADRSVLGPVYASPPPNFTPKFQHSRQINNPIIDFNT